MQLGYIPRQYKQMVQNGHFQIFESLASIPGHLNQPVETRNDSESLDKKWETR